MESLIGGGTAPTARLQSAAVSLRHALLQPQALLLALRRLEPPVVGRIHEDHVLLDLRTVEPEFDQRSPRCCSGSGSVAARKAAHQ